MKDLNSISAPALAPFFYDSFQLKDSFTQTFGNKRPFASGIQLYPAVNIRSNDEGFIFEIAAPGLSKENFTIQFEQDQLTIAYQQPKEEASARREYSLQEFKLESFHRRFSFKKQLIEEEKIEASYQDGILRLLLPKKETAKPKAPRRIAVS